MIKTSSDIFGPIIGLMRKYQEASPDEKDSIWEELIMKGEAAVKEFQDFDSEYNKIRDANTEQEETIRKLHELLDQQMKKMSTEDISDSIGDCEIIYQGYWEKLNEDSQKYLIMANYLYKLFLKDNKDFSPSVVELGRAIENELNSKIYSGYVLSLEGHTGEMTDYGDRYTVLTKAVFDLTNKGDYYISARAMVKYLRYLSYHNFENDYNNALRNYLEVHNIDDVAISEDAFTSVADEIFEKYRNEAAHPGREFKSADANKCREKTKKILKRFMNAVE